MRFWHRPPQRVFACDAHADPPAEAAKAWTSQQMGNIMSAPEQNAIRLRHGPSPRAFLRPIDPRDAA